MNPCPTVPTGFPCFCPLAGLTIKEVFISYLCGIKKVLRLLKCHLVNPAETL